MDQEGNNDVVDPVVHATDMDQPVGSPSVSQTPDEHITSNANMMENTMGTTGSSTETN